MPAEAWWNELNLELQIFYGIGILALFGLVIQLVLSIFFGNMDADADFSDGSDHGSGLSIFSVRGVIAFFVGFGWAGAIAINAGSGLVGAIAIGILVGGGLMLGIFWMMLSMLRLQSNGALDYSNAIGQTGSVYITIPADQKSGGQVELMIQGRLTMAEALCRGSEPLRPGTKIKVVEKIGHSTLIVEPLY